MQEFNIQHVPGLVAQGDLSAVQYHAVYHHATSGRVAACTDGVAFTGILLNAPDATGKAAEIAGPGSYCMAKIITAGIEAGQYLMCSTGGALTIITGDTDITVAQAQRDGTTDLRVLIRVMDPVCQDFNVVQ